MFTPTAYPVVTTIEALHAEGTKISETRSERLQTRLDEVFLSTGMTEAAYKALTRKLDAITNYA